jgi:hypothetical protein
VCPEIGKRLLDTPRHHSHLKPKARIDGLNKASAAKGKLDLLHRFARLYQHPLLLDSDGS